jgi:membrane protein YdbS with pleckstrin-like domain
MNAKSDSLVDQQSAARWYRSQVDWWILFFLLLPPLAAGSIIVQAIMLANGKGLLAGLLVLGFVSAVYAGLIFPMRYRIEPSELVVQSGRLRKRISLTAIEAVDSSRNPLSAPAMSLNRLRIKFGPGVFQSVLISPVDREEFLDQLAQASGMTRRGQQLVRQREQMPI